MKEKNIKKLIIDYRETWVKVTQDKFNSFLSDMDALLGEQIKFSWSDVFNTEWYYSPKIAKLIGSWRVNLYEYYFCAKVVDYIDRTYYINKNFKKIAEMVIEQEQKIKNDTKIEVEE